MSAQRGRIPNLVAHLTDRVESLRAGEHAARVVLLEAESGAARLRGEAEEAGLEAMTHLLDGLGPAVPGVGWAMAKAVQGGKTLVQEFPFGMNRSAYSRFVGDVFGAPLVTARLPPLSTSAIRRLRSTKPVTTPTAMLMNSRRPKNRVSSGGSGSPVRCFSLSIDSVSLT